MGDKICEPEYLFKSLLPSDLSVINLALTPRPQGEPGTAFTVKLPRPSNKEREETDIWQHATFAQFGAYMVWGVKPTLEKLIQEHKKKLTTYNQKLGRAKIPLRIRLTHTTTSKGHKYVYCGRFVYNKDGSYFGVLENTVLRNELKENWNTVGPPPRNPLEGLSYRLFNADGVETDIIIVPYNLYHDPRFSHLFAKHTRTRVVEV